MTTYVLPLPEIGPLPESGLETGGSVLSHEDMLFRNARWYCRLRWIVIAIFAIFGATSFIPGIFGYAGLKDGLWWPFFFVCLLSLTNVGFQSHLAALKKAQNLRGIGANMWAQILTDLIMATGVVHQMGSMETPVSFVYLFHIVLSCMFLSRRQSFAVTAIACSLYILCVCLEMLGMLPQAGIYADFEVRREMEKTLAIPILSTVSSVVTWAVVWYLASYLSSLVRKRELDLEEINIRLVRMQQEKMQHMLHTTHELKAPFAAIQANTQLLLKEYCGKLSEEVREVIVRIGNRSRRLTASIQEMLQLGNLRSQTNNPPRAVVINLYAVLRWAVSQVMQIAEEYGVTIDDDIGNATTMGTEDHFKILFLNLLSNAVLYSHRNGTVQVHNTTVNGKAVVTIQDHGIGIPADKLPMIFEEYYRTNEAVQHNKNSTGLGLAIVRHIAELYRIQIAVTSAPNIGTTFSLTFP